jgi:hypothetical protein
VKVRRRLLASDRSPRPSNSPQGSGIGQRLIAPRSSPAKRSSSSSPSQGGDVVSALRCQSPSDRFHAHRLFNGSSHAGVFTRLKNRRERCRRRRPPVFGCDGRDGFSRKRLFPQLSKSGLPQLPADVESSS